jgi:hypothetical protein
MVPVSTAGGIVTLACVDPQNRVGLDEMKRLLRGVDIKLMAVTEDDFTRFVAAQTSLSPAARVAQQAQAKNYAALAKRIVEWRDRHGPFNSPDDLRHVRGIGPSTARLLDSLVTFSGRHRPLASTRLLSPENHPKTVF